MIYGEEYYYNISLLFDESLCPVVLTEDLWGRVRNGDAAAAVAARIDDEKLIILRHQDAASYRPLSDVIDKIDIERITELVVRFMSIRLDGDAPYYGAIGASRHWGMPDSYKIYHDNADQISSIKASIESAWGGGVIVSDRRNYFSITFMKGLGNYLNDDDVKLVLSWSDIKQDANFGDIFDDGTLSLRPAYKRLRYKFLARLAEKSAMSIYSSRSGGGVEDCSILQIDGKDSRWRDFDIWDNRPIDVKNATIYRGNTRQNYIPKFKRAGGHNVVISAFATRVRLSTLSTRSNPSSYTEQIFLGETSVMDLESSKSAIDQIFPEATFTSLRFDERYLPAWAFENPFPGIDYQELSKAYGLFAQKAESVLACAIASSDVEETKVYAALNPEQKRVVDALYRAVSSSSYSKQTIVLFAIAGLASEIIHGRCPISFLAFLRRIISLERLEQPRAYDIRLSCPAFSGSDAGGLYDPLGSVTAILDLLTLAAGHIQETGLTFGGFHAPSPSILLGKLQDGRQITVYSHCGGKSNDGFPCETFPLVIGQNATCSSCAKLVCHECGYCSHQCSTH